MPKADDFQTARPFRPVREDGYPGSSALVPLGVHTRLFNAAASVFTLDPPVDAVAIQMSATNGNSFYTLDGATVPNVTNHTGFLLQNTVTPQTVWIKPGVRVSVATAANGIVNYQWLTAV